MGRTRRTYPPEFPEQTVELVREFEPTAQSIRNWGRQADLDEGRRTDGLTTEERAELRRLRRENRQLRLEREILEKAATWLGPSTSDTGLEVVTDSINAQP